LAWPTVRHGRPGKGQREGARGDDGDGVREVHCHGGEGAGAPLRTFWRVFRGVHKKYLADYVATYETTTDAKQVDSEIIRRMCSTSAVKENLSREGLEPSPR